jgi:hypothetical protein
MKIIIGLFGSMFIIIGIAVLIAGELLPLPTPPDNEFNMVMKAWEVLNTAPLGAPNKDKLLADYNKFNLEYEDSRKKYYEEVAERKNKYNNFIIVTRVMMVLGLILCSVSLYLYSVKFYTKYKLSRTRSREENSDSDSSDMVDT